MPKLEFKQLRQKIKFKDRKFKFTENQISLLKQTLDIKTKLMFLAGIFASPFYDKLEEMLEIQDIKLLREKKQFECMPVNFVRGANWNDRIVIVDEAQNFTHAELLTVLTRIGENSKIIICGDMMQSDIKVSGFSKIFNAFDDEESKDNGIHCVKFTNKDIKRSEILKFIVAKLEDKI